MAWLSSSGVWNLELVEWPVGLLYSLVYLNCSVSSLTPADMSYYPLSIWCLDLLEPNSLTSWRPSGSWWLCTLVDSLLQLVTSSWMKLYRHLPSSAASSLQSWACSCGLSRTSWCCARHSSLKVRRGCCGAGVEGNWTVGGYGAFITF